jgi:hypothetical protein
LSLGEGRSFQGIPATAWGGRNYFLNADLRVAFFLPAVLTIRRKVAGIRNAGREDTNSKSDRSLRRTAWTDLDPHQVEDRPGAGLPHEQRKPERKRVPVLNWSELPILAAIAVGFVGFCLMVAAFVLVARQGGWKQAMRLEPDGRWSLPRRLMFAGASLGTVFGVVVLLLFAIPGGIPWVDGSSWPYAVAVLPAIAAVWYFIIRRTQTAGPSQSRPDA